MRKAPPHTSVTSGRDGGSAGVGLSDKQYSAGRRKMLDLINRLHKTGVQKEIDLPVIAVIGSQSAGKSSLIESISGITLPRASGTCTRCPTECTLSFSAEPWRCVVSLRFTTNENGETIPVRNDPFGPPIFDKPDVEERLRRAQRAILNPSIHARDFLEGVDEDPVTRERTFSTNCVSLSISGPDVADLSFCDLPGLIATEGTGAMKGDIQLVKSLVASYIEKPSCIILLTVACETDFENQGAHQLAREYDPDGKRTIGVLTKPDRIPLGEEERWLRFIKNESEPLENGWFGVKQPDSRALAAGITWSEARELEREFFSSTSPWAGVDLQIQHHFGTANLTDRCSSILSGLIAKRLPEIQSELQDMLQKTENNLRQLPKPPSSDALGEVFNLLTQFSGSLAEYLEGTPEPDGLLQSIRPIKEVFRQDILATAPDFRPYGRLPLPNEPQDNRRFIAPEFLSHETVFVPSDDANAVYIDDVMERANQSITRQLPGYFPFVVVEQYIQDVIGTWEGPTRTLFDAVQHILIQKIKQFIEIHFEQYPLLQQRVAAIVTSYILECSDQTKSHLDWLLALEKRPRTLNEHYYRDYRDKFLAHYKGCRPQYGNTSLVEKLAQYNPSGQDASLNDSVSQIVQGFAGLGIYGINPVDLPKVLPTDPFEPAIDVMASVRAYFQVAYKRFTDNIPNAIDHDLILGLKRDHALEKALRKGLGIGGTDADVQCGEYIREPPNVLLKREELQKKRERLVSARKELMDLWL
ncbi:P-loop containing nucleoside triphosphate hydrolase protein [Sparassis latifolia]